MKRPEIHAPSLNLSGFAAVRRKRGRLRQFRLLVAAALLPLCLGGCITPAAFVAFYTPVVVYGIAGGVAVGTAAAGGDALLEAAFVPEGKGRAGQLNATLEDSIGAAEEAFSNFGFKNIRTLRRETSACVTARDAQRKELFLQLAPGASGQTDVVIFVGYRDRAETILNRIRRILETRAAPKSEPSLPSREETRPSDPGATTSGS